MEATARTASALLVALAVASGFLGDGAHGGGRDLRGSHQTRHTRRDSSGWPASPTLAWTTPPAVQAPPSPGAVTVYYVVGSFGAVGDGEADDTAAITAAWDAACQGAGPGVVLAAAGRTFLVRATVFAGPCRGSVTLQVDGTIVAPSEPDAWPADRRREWLVFHQAHGAAVRGGGLIDGKGQKWWDLPCKPHVGTHGANTNGSSCDSPVVIKALRFFQSNGVAVQGVAVRDSPQFHLRLDGCRGVAVRGVSIRAPAQSPNTDGIHVENTTGVVIAGCAISGGDDCVSIGAGTRDVLVENVTCGPGGHGISIGSLGKPAGAGAAAPSCVANVTVRGAVVRRSDNGVRIKTWQGGAGSVSAVAFEDVRVEGVRSAIVIDQYYCRREWCGNASTAAEVVRVSGVAFAGVRGTYDAARGGEPVRLACSDAAPCTGVALAGVELVPEPGTGPARDPFCWNAYGAAATPTVPPVPCLLAGAPPTRAEESNGIGCYPW